MRKGFDLDDAFWNLFGARNISYLDISGMKVSSCNMSSFYENCKTLKALAAVETHLETVYYSLQYTLRCKNVEVKTRGNVVKMLEIWCPKYGHIDNNSFCINVQLRKTLLFEKAQLYNVVNRCPELLVSLHFDGLNFSNSVQIRSEPRLNINSLNLSNTYMNVVGRKILYEDYRVSYLCMSYNDMTFLNPCAISNIISLRHLDFSFNSLQIMNVENNYLFANLLLHFRSLTFINLRRNSLSGLPEYFFRNNNYLEIIILSENKLSTVTFEIKHLREISLLDLRGNCIMTLDSSSMQQFDNLFQVQINENIKVKIFVNIVENNLTCSSCSDKVFVDWLQTEKQFFWNRTHKKCLSDNGSAVNVFNKSFTDMCTGTTNRKFHWLYWILCIVGLTGFSASVALSVRCLKRCKEKSRQVEPREKAVLDLTNLSKGSEYLVFLAFSSKDETFVNKNVVSPLQQCLQERVGMEKMFYV